MAHLGESYTSFDTFLNSDTVTGLWAVDLAALNSSGVNGTAIFAMNEEADGTRYLNVSIAVEGMTADAPVPQHIHGLFDSDGNPIDSMTPGLANDTDKDGMVEVIEGVSSYGDVLLPLSDDGELPTTDASGRFLYIENFDLDDDSAFFSPVTSTDYTAEDIMPLELRELVLHGVEVPDGIGAGTDGEVDGSQDGFVPILPAAAGEIEAIDLEQALDILEDQATLATDTIAIGDGGGSAFGGLGDDTITGGDGDDRLDGGADDDMLMGGLGNDRYVVDSAGDMISGEVGFSIGGGIDTVESSVDFTLGSNLEILRLQGDADLSGTGSGAPEALVGNAGANMLSGMGGDDLLNGKDGDDILAGGAGADVLVGEAGADVFDFDAAAETGAGPEMRDFINGFVNGEDMIDLADIDADMAAAGDQAFTFVGDAAFSGAAGELRYFTFGGGDFNIVEADVDGDASADMQIFVNQTAMMTADDFML